MTTPATGAHAADFSEGGRPDVSDASVGELIGKVSQDFSTLLRQELALAKAELKTEVSKAGQGAGMLVGAGLAAFFLVLFLSNALWWALANVMDTGLAALIVGVLWGIIAGALFVVGRSKLKQVNPTPERTVETLKDVPDAVRGR